MKLDDLVSKLDAEFDVPSNAEDLVDFAVTDDNRHLINAGFLEGKTGVMLKSSDGVERVFTAVFVSEKVVERVLKQTNSLVFTHHPFDYFEDERGIQPIDPSALDKLLRAGTSIYAAHGPLDTHPVYGTSICLAQRCGIRIEERFYDYFGAPAAVFGSIQRTDFDTFAQRVRKCLQRPCVTVQQHFPQVEKIAVAAGGGSLPDLLQMACDHPCDTLLTGTVENRWSVPFFEDLNRQFHDLNARLKLNLIGGTHFGTERPAMVRVVELFKGYQIPCEYCEDEDLLNAL